MLVGVAVVLAWPAPHPVRHSTAAPGPAAAARPSGTGTGFDPGSASDGPSRPEARAAAVLRAWDAHRAQAWAAGDARGLRDLYVPGSVAGRADVAMLARWRRRGLAVEGLTTQLLAVHVVSAGPRRLVLRVRDRVTGARVAPAGPTSTGPGPATPLAAGAEATWEVALRHLGGRWRVASVRPVGSVSAGRS